MIQNNRWDWIVVLTVFALSCGSNVKFISGSRSSDGLQLHFRDAPRAAAPGEQEAALLEKYCAGCHTSRTPHGGVVLNSYENISRNARDCAIEIEDGFMPPEGNPAPSESEKDALVKWLQGMQ